MDAADNTAILLLPGMDGTGVLLYPLAEMLGSHRSVHVISYPASKALGYDDLTTFVIENAPKGRFVILGGHSPRQLLSRSQPGNVVSPD